MRRALEFGRRSWAKCTIAYALKLCRLWRRDLPFETWVSHFDAFDRLHRGIVTPPPAPGATDATMQSAPFVIVGIVEEEKPCT